MCSYQRYETSKGVLCTALDTVRTLPGNAGSNMSSRVWERSLVRLDSTMTHVWCCHTRYWACAAKSAAALVALVPTSLCCCAVAGLQEVLTWLALPQGRKQDTTYA